jgi:hypothetical protein
MKFVINSKEFKNVMNLVKTVADSSANARITAHSICLLRALPGEKLLKLDFSLNGSFLTYTFEDVTLEGDEGMEGEFRRSVDLGSLASLKLSGSTIIITLGKNKEGNTLEFSSGKLKGKLILSHADIEKEVDSARPDSNAIELNQQFSVSDFLSALSAHNYGIHQNAAEASRRPVRIYNKKSEDPSHPDQIFFVSKDKIAAASFVKNMTTPFKEEFNYYVLPKPFQAVLNALPQDSSPVFHFGIAKDFWRLSHGQIDVWMPNIVQEVNFDLEELVTVVGTYPCFSLKAAPEYLQKALAEIAPFTSSSQLFTKDDMPIIRLTVENGVGFFTLNTSKAKDVNIEIEDIEFKATDLFYDPSDMLNLNFKYLSECVSSLANTEEKGSPVVKDKEKVIKDKEPIYLLWWPYKDITAPTKGKALCLKRGNNYYFISRVRDQQRTV